MKEGNVKGTLLVKLYKEYIVFDLQGAEFDVYDKYAEDILNPHGRERPNVLIQRNDSDVTFRVR